MKATRASYLDLQRAAQNEYIKLGVPWVAAYELYDAKVERAVTGLKFDEFEAWLTENAQSSNQYIRAWEVNETGDQFRLLYHLEAPPASVLDTWKRRIDAQPWSYNLERRLIYLLILLNHWRTEARSIALDEDLSHLQLRLWAMGYFHSLVAITAAAKHTQGVLVVDNSVIIFNPNNLEKSIMAATLAKLTETLTSPPSQTDDIVTDPARTDVGMPTLFRSVVAPPAQPTAPVRQSVPTGEVTDLTAPSANLLLDVSKKWLDDEPFDLVRIRSECMGFVNAAAVAIIQLGKRLNAVKEVLGYGRLLTWIDESSLPIGERQARQYMAIGQAIVARPQLARVADLGMQKAATLLSLEPELQETLAQDKPIIEKSADGERQLVFDDFALMNRKELQARVRALNRQLTEQKNNEILTISELASVRKELGATKEKLAELVVTGKRPQPQELEIRSDLENLARLVGGKVGWLKALDVSALSPELRAHLLTWPEQMMYLFEHLLYSLREKASEVDSHVPVPSGADWNETRERGRRALKGGHKVVLDEDQDLR